MFRAFLVSDCHVGNALPHAVAGPDGVTDRLRDQLAALRWSFAQADERKLPLVCTGDLFDNHLVDTVTLDMVAGALEHAPAGGFYVVPGNHDASDQTYRHFSPMALARLTKNVEVLDDLNGVEERLPLPGRELVRALPYCKPAVAREFFSEQAGKDRLLLAHLEVDGFGHGGVWTCSDGLADSELAGWGAVLTGHFHAQQRFKSVLGMYVGALCQKAFDDRGKPQGGWVVGWDGEHLEMEFVDYDGPTFSELRFTTDALGALMDKVDEVGADPMQTTTFMKLVVSGTPDELARFEWELTRERLVAAGARRVIFERQPTISAEAHRLDVDVSAPIEDLVAAYVRHQAVDTGRLDKDRLLRLGVEAVQEARARMRRQTVSADERKGD